MDSRHGKIVLPEEMVQTEIEARDLQQKKQDSHQNLYLQNTEREMLRDANIESVALGEAEQERLIREYYQKREEQKRSTDGTVFSNSDNQHQFVMGSRVQFGDPHRYGEIRWMGNIPQVDGLVAGVELVGN